MRARLALHATSTQCELREIVLRDKPESMLLLSPKGTVPVLQCADKQVIDESLDIMLWALRAVESHPWLSPEGGELADALQLIERAEAEFKCHLDKYKYVQAGQEEQSLVHRGLASDFLLELNERLGQGQWLFGGRKSLSDAALAPFVRQFANVDSDWFYAQPWEHLSQWLGEFVSSCDFVAIMKKIKVWQPSDPVLLFPFATASS